MERYNLLVVLVGLVVDNVEEAELVDALRGGDDAEPVTELLLLEELLGAIMLSVPLHHQLTCTSWGEIIKHTGTSGSGRRTPGAQ
jgi:hypothetical protein